MSPPRSQQGRGWEERLWLDLLVPLGKAGVPSPAQERARPGHGGTYGLLLGTSTNPALAPSLYPESHGQTTGTGTSTLALPRSLGSLRTLLYFGDPLHMLHGRLAPRGTARKIQETGQPSPSLHLLLICPGGRSHVSWRREERRWWRKGRLVTACPPRASCLGLLPDPLPGCSPGGPDVLRPLKPLVLSRPPRRPGCVCVSGQPSSSLDPTLPAAQRDRAGSTCPPWRQRKEKVFYI